ncbi:MAG: hypothetical protein A2X25_02485 [Chloroflexi bacterium GWB2_49_20]|nr:MAG: hypothetical protein A2X25_02485 [Chloroflexi bacterium GWB2_49_20]OGN79721.1 MAG: hypothetical protein A2X26_07465 [Chloroflexi bacterium GWC2_49_37]OGN85969.1 MAG: hypothetical protein A2X27_00225 [Chloroflexi bacterium GWD2_49_16]
MNKRILISLCIALVMVALTLVGCQPAKEETPTEAQSAPTTEVPATQAPVIQVPTEPCTVKVGAPIMITGVGAAMGLEIQDGAKLAVEKLNETGGVLGCQIELVFADVKGTSAEDCALAAQVMDENDVVFYIAGAYFSPACIDEFGKREPLLMHNSASKDMNDVVIANLPEYRNIFATCADEYAYGPNAFDVLVNQVGPKLGFEFPNKKVALLGGDITYDMYIQAGAKKAFEAAGWESVLNDTYPYGNTEFGSQLARIRAEKPAVVMGQITSIDSAVAFMNQFLTNPTNSLVYDQWAPASSEYITLLGEKANGVTWQTLLDILPQNKDSYYPRFQKEFGRLPGTFAPLTEDHFGIWKAAVESCGDFKAFDCIDTYVEQLDQHPYVGLAGRYGMDPATHVGRAGDDWLPVQFIQIQDQKNVTLYLGSKPMEGTAFQTPPWFK